MAITPHFGIRCMQDLPGDYSDCIVDSVDLLNSQLASHEMSFFFDSCDFRQQIIDGKHCWDMFGWTVPNELVHELEPAWIENDNVELEKYDYICASWEDLDGQPHAAIDGSLPAEAYA